jgi:DNA polymerase
MRRHESEGKIDASWRETYCLGNYRSCVRYQKEEAGIPHSDDLLPDGTYLDNEMGGTLT